MFFPSHIMVENMSFFVKAFGTCNQDSCILCSTLLEFVVDMNPSEWDNMKNQISHLFEDENIDEVFDPIVEGGVTFESIGTVQDGRECKMENIQKLTLSNGDNLYVSAVISILDSLGVDDLNYRPHEYWSKWYKAKKSIPMIAKLIADNPSIMAEIFKECVFTIDEVISILKTSYPEQTLLIIPKCFDILSILMGSEDYDKICRIMINIERLCQGTRHSEIGTDAIDTRGEIINEHHFDRYQAKWFSPL
jgi:hypothetical protein